MLACKRNLGQRASSQSVRAGVLLAGVAMGIGFLANEWGAVQTLGWLLAVPLAGSAYLIISGTFGVCMYSGLTGKRIADHGAEAVLDEQSRTRLRKSGLMAACASVLIACLLTVVFVASA